MPCSVLLFLLLLAITSSSLPSPSAQQVPPWSFSKPPPFTQSWCNLASALRDLDSSPFEGGSSSCVIPKLIPIRKIGSGKFSYGVYKTLSNHVIKLIRPIPLHRIRREIYCTIAAQRVNAGVFLEGLVIIDGSTNIFINFHDRHWHNAMLSAECPNLSKASNASDDHPIANTTCILIYSPIYVQSPANQHHKQHPELPLSVYPPYSADKASLLQLPSLLFNLSKVLQRLHSLNISHRDIKPSNILPSGFIDFGQSLPLDISPKPINPLVGTISYKPPELLALPSKNDRTSGKKYDAYKYYCPLSCDVYSFGCCYLNIVFRVVTNTRFLRGKKLEDIRKEVRHYVSRGENAFNKKVMEELLRRRKELNLGDLLGIDLVIAEKIFRIAGAMMCGIGKERKKMNEVVKLWEKEFNYIQLL